MKPVTKQTPNMTPSHTPSWLVSLGLRNLEGNAFMTVRLGSGLGGGAPKSGIPALRKSDGSGHGVFATAFGAGGVDIAMPDTLSMTGTVTCVDAAGVVAAAGTFQRTVTM